MSDLHNVLKAIGIESKAGMLWPVFEDDYIKFMSDGGTLDDEQGNQFKVWLNANKYTYQSERPRSFILGRAATAKLNQIFEISAEDCEGQRQGALVDGEQV